MPYLHIQISGEEDADLTRGVAQAAVDLTARPLDRDPALTAVVVDWITPSR